MDTCKYCGKTFKDARGTATHRRFTESCRLQWEQEQQQLKSSKKYVKCEVCGKELRNISNTHLKTHNLTQQQYKTLYPSASLFAEGLLEEQKTSREATIEATYGYEGRAEYSKRGIQTKIEKYGSIKEMNALAALKDPSIKEKQRKQGHINGSNLKNLYASTPEKLKEANAKRKQTCLMKYGCESVTQTPEMQAKSIETINEKYGSISNLRIALANKVLQKRIEGGTPLIYPACGNNSQKLFKILHRILKNKQYTIFYGTNNGEYRVQIANDRQEADGVLFRFLDFYIQDLNICIEFDEKYHNSSIQQEKDAIRMKQILSKVPSLRVLRISEEDFINHKKETIRKCINFIYSCPSYEV